MIIIALFSPFQHKTIVQDGNSDIVHHLLMHECNPSAVFDDNNLPDGLCDDLNTELEPCASNIASGWAVGGDAVRLRSSVFDRDYLSLRFETS